MGANGGQCQLSNATQPRLSEYDSLDLLAWRHDSDMEARIPILENCLQDIVEFEPQFHYLSVFTLDITYLSDVRHMVVCSTASLKYLIILRSRHLSID